MFKEVKFPRTEEWFELEVVLTAENDFFCIVRINECSNWIDYISSGNNEFFSGVGLDIDLI